MAIGNRQSKIANGSADPALQVAIAQLVQQHGREAVLAAAQEVARRSPLPDATREERGHLARLITSLKGVWSRDEIMRCLMLHKGKGIPVAISLEILDVVDRVRPANPWALINHVVHKDYPQWA
jgi:hypothetical protein